MVKEELMNIQLLLTAVILIAVVYMFFSPRFPNAVVATIGAVAVSLTGSVPFKTVFTNYASTSIVLMIGMMIVGGGMFHTGFAGWLGNKIVSKTGSGMKNIQVVAILSGAILSSACSGSAAMMILYPIFCSICVASNVSVSKVMFPMFAGIGMGSFMTLAGSGMGPATAAVLMENGYEGWEFFGPTTVGLPKAIIYSILLVLFMNKLLPDTHIMPDQSDIKGNNNLPEKLEGKMIISALILVVTIVGMVVNLDACPMHICAAIGGIASVLFGCLNQKQMFLSINWSTVFMIGGMTAVAKGMQESGLGEVIANGMMSIFGSNPSSFAIMMAVFFTTGIITQFMSNNAAVSIMAPIAISIAQNMGIEPYAFVMAALMGSGIGCLTPMATPILAFIMESGHYSPRDVFKWGLMECLAMIIAVAIFVPFFWMR